MFENIISTAESFGCVCERNADMSRYTTFRTGGPAELIVKPNSVDSLSAILKAIKAEGIKPLVLGRGSNVLAPDEGIKGVVIVLGEDFGKIEYCGNNMIRVQAGASVIKLSKFALEYELSGLEFAYGIPGTVGGAIYMNAGAYGGEMKDVVMFVNHMDLDGNRGSWQSKNELGLGYRHSNYMGSDLIITSVVFLLDKENPEAIKMKMDNYMERRKLKQPLDFPSAGSTFKRPEGYFAGALIQECGLKGASVGGAQVSEKHAGFVINKGGATSNDIKQLIEMVSEKVKLEKGVTLEPEVRIL